MSGEALPKFDDVGMAVARVMGWLRQASGGDSRFARHILAHDTHEEYLFAMARPDLVTIVPLPASDE